MRFLLAPTIPRPLEARAPITGPLEANRGHRNPSGMKMVTRSMGIARSPNAFQFMIRRMIPIIPPTTKRITKIKNPMPAAKTWLGNFKLISPGSVSPGVVPGVVPGDDMCFLSLSLF